MDRKICGVHVFTQIYSLDREYSYLIPEGAEIVPGDIVSLPFGPSDRSTRAVVTRILTDEEAAKADSGEFELKSITAVAYKNAFDESRLELLRYMTERYFTTYLEASRLLLPPGSDPDARGIARKSAAASEKYVRFVSEENASSFLDSLKSARRDKYKDVVSLFLSGGKFFSERRGDISLSDLKNVPGVTPALIKRLCEEHVLEISEKREFRDPFARMTVPGENDAYSSFRTEELNDEQSAALSKLSALLSDPSPHCALLFGVTGSGKTRVMLRLIDEAISSGKNVIMLVPEIALTGQAMRILISRYGEKVAVLHSALSDGERNDEWDRISSGEKSIILGTRSAIFAPCKNVGLVIIDEEQDQSYKSDSHVRYHARDIAKFICAKSGALLLLASATPDLDSFYRALSGKYELLKLRKRYGDGGIPDVVISDVRNDFRDDPGSLIGRELSERISRALEKNEQIILFVNRRGYNRFIICRSCSEVIMCPNCSVSLTYHVSPSGSFLQCHYCGYRSEVPSKCPSCGSDHLYNMGFGTQQVEKQLSDKYPAARVMRLDADTVTKKDSHDKILNAFKNHKADILVGTQMVAKGHDFPGVTLVGVILADGSLYSSDYKAKEQSFSLFTQVIGRAGRSSKRGTALIQTFSPYNEALNLAASQDYERFYDSEIALRKALLFPPFCDICVMELKDENEERLNESSEKLMKIISDLLSGEFKETKIILYGPFEAMPYKINNIYRKKCVVKFRFSSGSSRFLKEIISEFRKVSGKTLFSVDINPKNV